MRTAEIRRRFLTFFQNRDHTVVPSASLISEDPSLLFTAAGMVPFIPYMLGIETPPYRRATSVQKCVRTLDIEEVGKTTRHGTFFQMNGNFSFGDYFKEGAITYAWELITGSQADGGYGFDPQTIWVTVYQDDDEAARLWRTVAGLPEERIQRRGIHDNYWSTGQPGPAGPCSEIYVDRGAQYGPDGGPVVDEDRFLEIWNLVFMQFERGRGGAKDDYPILGELASKNIDTGMGLERVAYLLQGVHNLYEIDEVRPVITRAEELSGRRYGANHGDDVRMRVVADHVRSALMLIGDGVTPANEGRGYVLRRLVRRAVRAMRLLGVQDMTMPELLPVSLNAMKESYPELERDFGRISQTAYAEEEAFRRTLASGTTILDTAVAKAKQANPQAPTISGTDAFTLHDTYGFPIDLTLEMASEQGVAVDADAFRTLMAEQRERAQADAKAKKTGHADTTLYANLMTAIGGPITFLGYTESEADGRIVAILADGVETPVVTAPAQVEIVLDRTPFYAEAGGQLADHGRITLADGGVFEVQDVQAPVRGLNVHRGRLISGTAAVGGQVHAAIDTTRRRAIARAHTATHMVHKALRTELGDTATQAGSENAPARMRFDFRYGSSVPADAMAAIEGMVNDVLADDLEVTDEQMPIARAREMGAMALFGEKYGDIVRVVSIGGPWSRELCGGTHVGHTGELGRVAMLGEASIGSGVRRVEALVADRAYEFHAAEHALVARLTDTLKVRPEELEDRISATLTKLKETQKELEAIQRRELLGQVSTVAAGAASVGRVRLVAHEASGADGDGVRQLALAVRDALGSDPAVVAIASAASGRPVMVIATNAAAREAGIKAGALMRVAAKTLGGGGGGKDDIAQGGGTDSSAIPAAFTAIREELGR